jgi:hypothetical protein
MILIGGSPQAHKPTYSEKNLSQCHCAHHKTQTKWPGIETKPPKNVTATIRFSHWVSLKNVFRNVAPSSQAVGGMWQWQHAELRSTRH